MRCFTQSLTTFWPAWITFCQGWTNGCPPRKTFWPGWTNGCPGWTNGCPGWTNSDLRLDNRLSRVDKRLSNLRWFFWQIIKKMRKNHFFGKISTGPFFKNHDWILGMLTTPNISEKGFEVGQPFVQGGHTVVQGGQPFVQGGQPFVHSRVSHTVDDQFLFQLCCNTLAKQ